MGKTYKMDKSRRYCLICRKATTWKRKKKEYHSSCSVCGGVKGCRTFEQREKGIKIIPRKKYPKEWIINKEKKETR